MNAARNIDIHSLQEKAERSEEKEAFVVLAKINACRIGVGVRFELLAEPTFFIEVLVRLCAGQYSVDMDKMENKLLLLRRLEKKGFLLNCNEDGYVSCELFAHSKQLNTIFKDTHSEVVRFVKTRNWRRGKKDASLDS